jgi:hypothetical protein
MKYDEISIQIQREIKIETYLAQMDIAVQKPAGLFVPIAELAKANDNKIHSELLQKEFEFTIPMANQAILRSVRMGILEEIPRSKEKYRLTQMGEQLILPEGGQVFQKETGEYRIFLTQDPLLPQKVLSLQRIEKGFRHERQMKPFDHFDVESLKGIIQNFARESDEKISNLINSADIQIEKCYDKVFPDKNRDLSIKIIGNLTPISVNFKLEVTWKGKKQVLSLDRINPDITFELVFRELLRQKGELGNWDTSKQLLNVLFDVKTQNGINYRDFVRTLSLQNPSISNFGPFEPIKCVIPVGPQNPETGLQWAKFLLLEEIKSVCNSAQYQNKRQDIESRFLKLGRTRIRLPEQQSLIVEIKDGCKIQGVNRGTKEYGPRSDKYWFLQTALDLLE